MAAPRPATPSAARSPIWPWGSHSALPRSAAAAPALLAQPGSACSVKEAPSSLVRRPFFPRASRARAGLLRPGRHPHRRGTHRTWCPTPLPRRPATPSPPPTLPATPSRSRRPRPREPLGWIQSGEAGTCSFLARPHPRASPAPQCAPRALLVPAPAARPIHGRCRTGAPGHRHPRVRSCMAGVISRGARHNLLHGSLGAECVGVRRAPGSSPGVAAWGCRLVPRASHGRNSVSPWPVETPPRATSYK